MLIIMSILMFTFLICEIIVLSSIGEAFKNGFINVGEIRILTCVILICIKKKYFNTFSCKTIITIWIVNNKYWNVE